jgi:hypothetical protein
LREKRLNRRHSRNSNSALNSAKSAKNDEFYTQLTDIERELSHYASQLKGQTIFCNCDDPAESNFFLHFLLKFNDYKIKKLITTHYVAEGASYKIEVNNAKTAKEIYQDIKYNCDFNSNWNREMLQAKNVIAPLQGNGDFRSPECIELLQKSDIVITNPPFSLFREFVATLVEYRKKFLIISNDNVITYKEIFPLIKENKVWRGYERVKQFKTAAGDLQSFGNVGWFTNLSTTKRNDCITLYETYSLVKYPKYDNYDAIEVSKVAEIPKDYDGCMGVPITFLDKYNPKQFEIVGQTGVIEPDGICIEYKGGRPYIKGKRMYSRIIIRRR